ncbi:MAG: gamma-glutamyltransferase [Thermoleophilia bacterium]
MPPLGVVAGGHPASARAGADVLEAGGNAADAAVAAVAASLTAEACLTGLGAGGFALVREPDGRAELLDFFVAAAGMGRTTSDLAGRAHLHPYEVPFRSATQVFNVGASSCAVPGMSLGLAALHERHGRLPLTQVLAPAIALAHEGVVLIPQQDYLHDILAGILTVDEPVRAIFAPRGRLLRAGETLRFPDLGDALEVLAAEGPAPFTTGRYAKRMASFLQERGGLITSEDLAAYRVAIREPIAAWYRGHHILTNPKPSSGGSLIAHTLGLLDRQQLGSLDPGELAVALARAMVATDEGRRSIVDGDRPHGGDSIPGNTTHVCAIDAQGLTVSVTSSCGSGSGVVVEGTGIYMNNMMGEEDLNPGGFFKLPPGERLASMMSPTIAYAPAEGAAEMGELLTLGSAGSERLRSAIVQILVNLLDLGRSAQDAVDQPRLHHQRGTVHAEGGTPAAVVRALQSAGYDVNRWTVTDLFFGGAQVAVRRAIEGEAVFDGGGDGRRGGAAIVV